ncbi:MAG: hypothetical protein LBF75_02970 [Treponema sp.]|nr:hypothetical protein [Treponema sp.]
MIRSTGNRLPRIVITGFTVLAVLVSFCLAAVEPLRIAQFVAERTGSADGSIDCFIPSRTEAPALLTKMKGPRFTPLRTGFQRIFIHGEPHKVVSVFCQSSWMATVNSNTLDVKDTILLKLRI